MVNKVKSEAEGVGDQIARLTKRVESMEASFNSIDRVLRAISDKLDMLLDQHARRTENIIHKLSEKQQAVFSAIQSIPGRDETARLAAQVELQKLKGDTASEAFAEALKKVLKDRQWGLSSSGGEPAAPLWQTDDSSTGGVIRLFYRTKDTNQPTYGERYIVLPAFFIVDRPDGRKRPKPTKDV
ncbi:MAG: hypothetical protein KBD00_02775 [Candidatus Peribacteraceae bacterium]|nr:hypothetical protein [Candidatus Peribacteraceae bacterium]